MPIWQANALEWIIVALSTICGKLGICGIVCQYGSNGCFRKGATLGVVFCVGGVWGCYMGVMGFISNFALFASSFYLIKHPLPLKPPF